MRRFPWITLAVFGLYLLVAVVVTWPLLARLGTHFAGFVYGDAYEMAHHIWWFKFALQTGEPLYYQTLSGYPDGIDGVTLWTNPLQFFPGWLFAFVLPLAAAQNLTILLYLALNGLALYGLMRYLLNGAHVPAFVAGLVYMLYPTMQGHLGASHVGLLVQFPLPLYVYALYRLRETRTRRWILLAALLFIVSQWGHTLQLIYTVLPVTGVFALVLLWRHEWVALRRVVIAATLGLIGQVIFLLPVMNATFGTAVYTDEGGMVRYSADLLALVTPSFLHPVYSRWGYTHRVLGINLDEGAAYIGWVVLLLVIVGAIRAARARWWLLLALIAYVLSLGPLLKIFDQPVTLDISGSFETFITLPWAALSSLPVFNLARTPGRFNFTLALAVAALAGYGMAYLWVRLRARRGRVVGWATVGLLSALIVVDYQTFWPLPTAPAAVPPAITDLRDRADVRAVFNIPWDNLVAAKTALYLQTQHEQPLIAGQVTRRTPVDPARLTLLETTLDPALLNEAGADIVIVHRVHDFEGALFAAAAVTLGEPIYSDERFALFETPSTLASPDLTVLPTNAEQITNRADSYLYTPTTGWGVLRADVNAAGREVVVYLNGAAIQRWPVDGTRSIVAPLPLAPGYQTVTLAVEPPCPVVVSEALRCRALTVNNLSLDEFTPLAVADPIAFENGVTLMSRRLPERTPEGDSVPVWLWWRFDAARDEDDIRFVHLLDANGQLAAQVDTTLGQRQPGTQLVEVVHIPLPADLLPGRYTVFTGWYTFPDGVRFNVLSEVPGDELDVVFVGEVVIP